jgi:flavin-dependent dehydrogenase
VTETADAVIVGGGPAGSTCAGALTRGGLDVLVVDQAVFPRDKVCAGWITPAVVEALGLDLDDYRRGRTLQPISRFRTGVIGGPTVETHYDHPVSFGILRREFDTYLLERSGARRIDGVRIERIAREGRAWRLNDDVSAPLLVGAGGHFCPVARAATGARRDEPIVAASEVEFPLTPAQERACAVGGETPELYFCPDLKGYGWCFRKEGVLNVGLGRQDKRRLTDHAARFLAWLVKEGRVPADVPSSWRGHAYLLYTSSPRRLVDDGVVLIGDAAGLAYPQSGEGIRPAIESGLLAARVILAAGGRYGVDQLRPYQDAIEHRFGQRTTWSLAGLLPETVVRATAQRLLRTRLFSRHVLVERWFLHTQHEALS